MISGLAGAVRRTISSGTRLQACNLSNAVESRCGPKIFVLSPDRAKECTIAPLAVSRLPQNQKTPFEEHLLGLRGTLLARQSVVNPIFEYETVLERSSVQITPTVLPFVSERSPISRTGCEIIRNEELGITNEIFETGITDESARIQCTRKDQRGIRRLKMKKHKRKKWLKKYGLFFREKLEEEKKQREAELQKWSDRVRLCASGFDPKAHVSRVLELARRNGYYVDVCRDLPSRS